MVELLDKNELADLFLNEYKALAESTLNEYKEVAAFAWENFSKASLNLNRVDAWRYFPFNNLVKALKEFSSHEAPTKVVAVVEESSGLASNSISIVNGCLDKIGLLDSNIKITQSRYADQKMVSFFDQFFKHEVDNAKNPLVFLNGSLANSAILINVDSSNDMTPTIKIELLSNEKGVSWPMIGFNISPEASLNVEVHVKGEDDKSLLIANLFAKVEDRGQLNIDFVQRDNNSKGIIFQNRFFVEESASLKLNGYCSGGQLNRFDTEISITHENSLVDVSFLTVTKENHQQHHYINMNHDASDGQSSQLFRNLLFDKGVVSVDGTVLVKEGAVQTNSDQLINNLFFSDDAKANTKPNLSILNDDVKCNHGATFGQLEEESLFYLKSRGLPEKLAIELLTKSFATEVIEKFHSISIQDEIKKLIR